MEVEVSEMVDQVILGALECGASDLHFNPCEEGLRVWIRIHGRLLPLERVTVFPDVLEVTAIARLKVLAKLSLAERRRPQDGQFHLFAGDQSCDVRIATMPTIRGERAVVRILPTQVRWTSMASLCLPQDLEQEVRHFFAGAGGMLVVAGKVGSGKSTTLHALLQERYHIGDSVLTIEDPVERRMDFFSQVEVDEKLGLTFPECLRTALRQDPDMLMVGEIRDELTAQIAVRAGLTGHHILSTVHADNPEQVLTRLLEFGVQKSYLAQALKLIIWQRLVPLDCPHCQGAGCKECAGIGVSGRQAEFQMFAKEDIQAVLREHTATRHWRRRRRVGYAQRELKLHVAEGNPGELAGT